MTLLVRSTVSLLLVEDVVTNNLTELLCQSEFTVSLALSRPLRIIYPWNIGRHLLIEFLPLVTYFVRCCLIHSQVVITRLVETISRVCRDSTVLDSSHSSEVLSTYILSLDIYNDEAKICDTISIYQECII